MAVIVRQLNVDEAGEVQSIDGPGVFYIPEVLDASRFDSWSIMFKADAIVGNIYLEVWSSHLPEPDPVNVNDWVVIKSFVLNENTKNTLVEWDNASHRWLAYRLVSDVGEAIEGTIYFKGNGDN